MRYRIVAVGRVRDAALRAASDEYLGRVRRYARVEEHEVKDEARDVAFAIGGADALQDDVLARAERVWSLSPLTLPHELARVILYEQLYRAFTIRRGEPYHHGP